LSLLQTAEATFRADEAGVRTADAQVRTRVTLGARSRARWALVILGGLMTSMALNLLVLPTRALRFGRFEPEVDELDVTSSASPKLYGGGRRANDCGFRRKPATHSDAKPASVPI
jgi:hypothetical protein